ncbi:unnamed protein product [Gongylonema pulchrum]|uniref:Uncharacterized protein n=1 Tax=Gongylonema pulchrum TaxID=637853 RepID=A0A183EQ57_9BILA|nr:unnamed protein product [Gongylonema pulchrum]
MAAYLPTSEMDGNVLKMIKATSAAGQVYLDADEAQEANSPISASQRRAPQPLQLARLMLRDDDEAGDLRLRVAELHISPCFGGTKRKREEDDSTSQHEEEDSRGGLTMVSIPKGLMFEPGVFLIFGTTRYCGRLKKGERRK